MVKKITINMLYMKIMKVMKRSYNAVNNFLNSLEKSPEPKTLLEMRVRDLREALYKKHMDAARAAENVTKSKNQDVTKQA
jgi:hypothetical protein